MKVCFNSGYNSFSLWNSKHKGENNYKLMFYTIWECIFSCKSKEACNNVQDGWTLSLKEMNKGKINKMSCLMTKPTKGHMCPAKTQISLGIHPVWSESSLSAWRKLGSLATNWVHSEDCDQTGRIPMLICVFAGLTVILLVLSWADSSTDITSLQCYGVLTDFLGQMECCIPLDSESNVLSTGDLIVWLSSPYKLILDVVFCMV